MCLVPILRQRLWKILKASDLYHTAATDADMILQMNGYRSTYNRSQ